AFPALAYSLKIDHVDQLGSVCLGGFYCCRSRASLRPLQPLKVVRFLHSRFNFVNQVFFGKMAAAFIGLGDSMELEIVEISAGKDLWFEPSTVYKQRGGKHKSHPMDIRCALTKSRWSVQTRR